MANLQVTRYCGAGWCQRVGIRGAVLVRVTKPGMVYEAEGRRIVQERVEDRTSIEDDSCDISMGCSEFLDISDQLTVVVGQGRRDACNNFRPLVNQQRSAVRWRDRQE